MKKKEMWIRRTVSTTILLLIVVLIIFAVSKVAAGRSAKKADKAESVQQEQSAAEILTCAAKDLNGAISFEPGVIGVGQETKANLEVRNLGSSACKMSTDDLQAKMVTGQDEVWFPSSCSAAWSKPLLLDAGQTWSTQMVWDGHLYSDCEAKKNEEGTQLLAQPGTYQLEVTYNGAPLAQQPLVIDE